MTPRQAEHKLQCLLKIQDGIRDLKQTHRIVKEAQEMNKKASQSPDVTTTEDRARKNKPTVQEQLREWCTENGTQVMCDEGCCDEHADSEGSSYDTSEDKFYYDPMRSVDEEKAFVEGLQKEKQEKKRRKKTEATSSQEGPRQK